MTRVGARGTMYGQVDGAFIIVALQNYLAGFGQCVAVIQGVSFGAKSKTAGDAVMAEMKAEGVVANHAYSLMSVSVEGGTVDLRNPWGVKDLNGFAIEQVQKYFGNCKIGAK